MTNVTIFLLSITFILIASISAWLLTRVDWSIKLAEPVVVASLVAALTTGTVTAISAVGTMVSGAILASNQKSAEIEKMKATILLSIVQQYDSSLVPQRNENNQKQRMTVLIQSGIIPDDDGSICMALIKEGCPIKVLKASP